MVDVENGVNPFLPAKYGVEKYNKELLVEASFYTASGRLKDNDRGYSTIRFERYDDKVRFGEKKMMSYSNAANQPVISLETGFCSARYDFDLNDNKLLETYYDVSGNMMAADNDKAFQIRYTYDQDNNCIKTEYLRSDAKPVQLTSGIAVISSEFVNGYEVKFTRYDSENRIVRTSSAGDGISIVKTTYDQNGNKITQACFDGQERPMESYLGV
jgi:hypothetical protein